MIEPESLAPDPGPESDLAAQLYTELRAVARRQMRGERDDHTLSATALVHEAYLRLGWRGGGAISDRTHFYAAAIQAMRRVLLDHARSRGREKRGHGVKPLSLDRPIDIAEVERGADYEALDEAIELLGLKDPRLARIVSLRFLCGFSVEETAELLEIPARKVKSEWGFARAWLARRLGPEART